jgi:hypothetical protein
MRKKLPDFSPIPKNELRELYRKYQDNEDVVRIILELQRARNQFAAIEDLRESIQKVWHEEVGGDLVALYHLRRLLQDEKWREADNL